MAPNQLPPKLDASRTYMPSDLRYCFNLTNLLILLATFVIVTGTDDPTLRWLSCLNLSQLRHGQLGDPDAAEDSCLWSCWKENKSIWGFPEWGVPPNHHFNRIFSINHPFWGTPISGNLHLYLFVLYVNSILYVPRRRVMCRFNRTRASSIPFGNFEADLLSIS